jgi:hypothetical protein
MIPPAGERPEASDLPGDASKLPLNASDEMPGQKTGQVTGRSHDYPLAGVEAVRISNVMWGGFEYNRAPRAEGDSVLLE